MPIPSSEELTDEVITSTGSLNLASGEIHRVEYQDHDVQALGLPWESEDYEFTCGVLSNAGKDVEFRIDVHRTPGQYSVSASELLEIKVRAAALFAGVTGKALLVSNDQRAAGPREAKPAATAPAPVAPVAPRGPGRQRRSH